MIEITERQIAESLRALGRMRVNPQAADHTLSRIRDSLSTRQSARSRWISRWMIPSGLAAGLLIALIVCVQQSVQPASAAERLSKAGQATRNYQGWIHQKSKIVQQATTADYPVETELHCDTTNGIWVDILRFKDHWQATMRNPQTLQLSVYQSNTNTLTISTVDQKTGQHWANSAENAPWTIDEALDIVKNLGMKKELTVRERMDRDLDRFDITFPSDDPRTAQAQHRSELPKEATIWTDPQTRLIRRWDITTKELRAEGDDSYGPPTINDLYDVGVPRPAQVKRVPTTQRDR